MALEVQAYFRGEPTTSHLVSMSLDLLVGSHRTDELMDARPKNKWGTVTIDCTDGPLVCILDLGTLCRHFELFSDLYELDPGMKRVKLPFSRKDVICVLHWIWFGLGSSQPPQSFDCIDFLRPKSASFYLYQKWNELMPRDVLLKTALRIGSELDRETRMANSQLSDLIPEWDLYPIASWMRRTNQWTLLHLLLEDYPSARLVISLVPDAGRNFALKAMDVVFKDKKRTHPPLGWKYCIDDEQVLDAILSTTDSEQCKRILASLGVQEFITETVTYPFGKCPTITPSDSLDRAMSHCEKLV